MEGRRFTPDSWDRRFLALAEHVAQWSKDPSSKVGAVIVRPDRTICSLGYNGFPRGMEDHPDWLQEREEKLARTIHAELNAILSAREPVKGHTLYTTFFPCDRCAVTIMQAGITAVVARRPTEEQESRWGNSLERSRRILSPVNGIWSLEVNSGS